MWLSSRAGLLWAGTLFLAFAEALFLRFADTCAPGEYWCQDRCGSDAYGDTCCQTPNGQHNLCGAGTICCMYGCCPSGTVCNAVGGCDIPDSMPQPSNSVSATETVPMSVSGPCGQTSTITAQTTITERYVITDFVTLTFFEACSSLASSSSSLVGSSGGSSTSLLSSTSSFSSSSSLSGGTNATVLPSTGPGTGMTTNPGTSLSPSTFTAPDGQTIVSSGSFFIIGGSETVSIPGVSTRSVLITDGETFTLNPAPTGSSSSSGSPPGGVGVTTVTSNGQTFTLTSSGAGTGSVPSGGTGSGTQTGTGTGSLLSIGTETSTPPSNNPGATTFTEPDGQTVISSSGVLIIGTNTVTLPTVSSQSLLTTDGETFTLFPPSTTSTSSGSPGLLTTTLPDGQTITLPIVISLTTLITDGETFTLSPSSSSFESTTSAPAVLVTTLPDGQTITSSSGIIVIGSSRITLPTVTSPTTLVTDGETFTLSPTNPAISTSTSSTPAVVTSTLPNGQTITSSSGIIIIGSDTLTVPTGLTTPTTITTDGATFTFQPSTFSLPSGQLPSTTSSSSSSTAIGPLPTYTSWPPGAEITPVTTPVNTPQPTDGGSVTSCKLWFFFICIQSDDITIGGWEWILPPGIYPPGPPPPSVLKLPPGFTLEGSLPPWPEITVGPNLVPTYPSEPDNNQCETESASICATTTSYGVTVSNQETITTTSQVASTCATILGCDVTNTATTAATTGACPTTTVTDYWVSCASSSCTTTSSSIISGCSVTASTITTSCIAAASSTSGLSGRADGPSCGVSSTYVVYPLNGTDTGQTNTIMAQLQTLVDPSQIYTSSTKTFGINFWTLPLTADQAASLRSFPGVATVYPQCSSSCYDPTTTLSYQPKALDQLLFVSQEKGRDLHFYPDNPYFFDDSAGQGIPVYIVDTGATADHEEFMQGDNITSRLQWIFVGTDVDGTTSADDSSLPKGGYGPGKGHGTEMLSLVAGATLGVSKRVQPILVRVPRRRTWGGGSTPEDWLQAVSMVNDAFSEDSTEARAIILMAIYYPRTSFIVGSTDYSYGFQTRLWALLVSLIKKGVVPVTGSGNGGQSTIDGWPAGYGLNPPSDNLPYIPELLVAGAVSPNGELWFTTNSDLRGVPNIYAPGFEIQCADGNKQNWNFSPLKGCMGTSCAAANTAGLAAYILKLGQLGRLQSYDPSVANSPDLSPMGIKSYILHKAWSRLGDLPGIWNLVTKEYIGRNGACLYSPNPNAVRRQVSSVSASGSCIRPTSSASSSTSSTSSSLTTTSPTSSPPLLPTLTPTAWPSNCISTATFTLCAPGPGGQSACVTSESCAATSTPPPLSTLTTTAWPRNCISTVTFTLCAPGPGGQSACVTSESCAATSTSAPPPPPPPPPSPTPTPYFDCEGSILCSTLQVKYCDHAVNTLNDNQEYGTEPGMLTGNCWADITGDGCGVFVQGPNCVMSGIDMWNTYQKIRAHGCSKCGSWHKGNGCLLTINYVTNCDNTGE